MSSDAPIKSSQICRACGHLVPMELYAEARGGGKVTVCNTCLNEWDLDYRKRRLRQKARSAASTLSRYEADPVSRDAEVAAAKRVSATLRKDVDEIVGGLTNREIASFIDKSRRLRTNFWDILDFWKRCGGLCEICGMKLLIVSPIGTGRTRFGEMARCDHDHVDGRVRGFLCAGCNMNVVPGYELAIRNGIGRVSDYMDAKRTACDIVISDTDIDLFRYRADRLGVDVVAVAKAWKRCNFKCELCGREIFLMRPDSGDTDAGPACCDHDHASGRVRGFLCNVCNAIMVPGYEAAVRHGENKVRKYLGIDEENMLPHERTPLAGDSAVGHTGKAKRGGELSSGKVSAAIHRLLGDWTSSGQT